MFVMSAATCLMFAKDQRGGGLMCPPRAPAGLPTPILKKILCLEMIFRTLGTKKIKKLKVIIDPC